VVASQAQGTIVRRFRGREHMEIVSPTICAIGTAVPAFRLNQEEAFQLCEYKSALIRNIFLNSDIDYRHFYLDGNLGNLGLRGTSNDFNRRYLEGAMKTGCQAIQVCLQSVDMTPDDIDFLIVCTSTGYVCPDLGSRLIGHMGFRHDIQRGSMLGLGCGGALPTLQRACDFVRAYPSRRALMLAVEICSACYFVDSSMETVVGNAICADGAAAFLLGTASQKRGLGPSIVDFQSCIDPAQIGKVGFEHRDGKLRIVLATEVRDVASALIERALDPLLQRNGLSRSDIRFWVAHPGGRKVIDKIQQYFDLTASQLKFSSTVLRSYGNMSSPTVMFVLNEVIRNGNPRQGDWGVMIALGPGMAAEVALLQW
jgi:3,5-dihydroxyphenylacetyl-CoA synthase